MSFDGILLHKLMPELQILKTGRITKIIDSGETDFIFTIRANHQNYNLMVCLSSDYSRIHITKRTYDTPEKPKSITMLLRKHIEGFFIEDITQYQNDRIVVFKLSGLSEMKDHTHFYLICEIMGRYSNMILTDQNYRIVEVLKHDGVSEFNRTMLPNATYQFPITNKQNPYKELNSLNYSSPKELCNQLEGISMLLAHTLFKNDQVEQNLKNALDLEIKPSIILNEKGKKDFYFHPFDYESIKQYDTISELLEEYYYEADTQAKIKSKTNDLVSFIQKNILKNEKKIKKLETELIDASNSEEYKIKGELLLSYPKLKEREKKVSIYNYYTNQEMIIELDPKYTVLENSQRYYKKYQKTKTSIHYIQEQIQTASNEIEYFKLLLNQLKNCSINDALEIQQELIDNKYLFMHTPTSSKKKRKPNFITYLVDDISISVGKNNVQNEYITHHLSKPNDMWFHIKDGSGSHVVVHSSELNEKIIRTAAQLAAYYSSFEQSSSVAVDYTLIKNIKKIPGKKNCFVTYTKQKTIYIDPDQQLIESLRIKK